MIEIERKYRVDDAKDLRRRLAGLQAVAESIQRHVDTYYRHPCRDFVATGEALRIRRVNGRPLLTYKGPKTPLDGPGMEGMKMRQELEWALAPGDRDGSKMSQLLEQLGFTMVAEVAKRREPFEVLVGGRTASVTIDTVDSLGVFAEVECMAEGDEDRQGALKVVEEVSRRLGCTHVEPRSYLRMVLEANEGESAP